MNRFCAVLLILTVLIVRPLPIIGAEQVAKTSSPARVIIGDVAPDFALTADNDQIVHLSDYRKKKRVILFFFTNVQAADCVELCCGFRDCYKKYKDKDGEILAISPDSVSELKAFKAKNGVPYLLLSDPDNKIRNEWIVPLQRDGKSCRTTYIIDKRGKVKKIITSEGTPIEYMKEVDDGYFSPYWFIGG